MIENWYMYVLLISVLIVCVVTVKKFTQKPTEEQIANLKEWLLHAVIEAEKQLGGGTGKLKLRSVYDKALERFPFLSVVSFDLFSSWVDEVLLEMKRVLNTNEAIAKYVKGSDV